MIVGALRVKSEQRWIADVLCSIQPLCERIVVFDDSSEDDTPEICRALGATVLPSPFVGLNEVRDKRFLLAHVRTLNPDWCLMVDGDEILQDGAAEKILAALSPEVASYSLRIRYLWDTTAQERADGIYGHFKRGSLFRLAGQPSAAQFRGTANGGNFHCGNVPAGLIGREADLDVSLLHLGYLHREDRIRKYFFYNENDPGNVAEDCYRHVCQGDLPEIPASMRLRYAGPLELQPL